MAEQNRDPRLKTKKIYLHEADEYIGPFCSRQDAELFIEMMELFGGSCEGVEVVEMESDSSEPEPQRAKQNAVGLDSTDQHRYCRGK